MFSMSFRNTTADAYSSTLQPVLIQPPAQRTAARPQTARNISINNFNITVMANNDGCRRKAVISIQLGSLRGLVQLITDVSRMLANRFVDPRRLADFVSRSLKFMRGALQLAVVNTANGIRVEMQGPESTIVANIMPNNFEMAVYTGNCVYTIMGAYTAQRVAPQFRILGGGSTQF
jgi:branched-subunit amino acid transport protein